LKTIVIMPVTVENNVWKHIHRRTGEERTMNYIESQLYAKQKGLCFPCGRPTHRDHLFGTLRVPLDDEDVYNGICIGCHPSMVPDWVYETWKRAQDKPTRPEQPIEVEEEPEPEPVVEPEPEPEPEPYEPEPEPYEPEPEPVPEPYVPEPEAEPVLVEDDGPKMDWRKAWIK
jgi:hypothetical protein